MRFAVFTIQLQSADLNHDARKKLRAAARLTSGADFHLGGDTKIPIARACFLDKQIPALDKKNPLYFFVLVRVVTNLELRLRNYADLAVHTHTQTGSTQLLA